MKNGDDTVAIGMKKGYMDEIFYEQELNNSKLLSQLLDQFFAQIKNSDEKSNRSGKALTAAVFAFFSNIQFANAAVDPWASTSSGFDFNELIR